MVFGQMARGVLGRIDLLPQHRRDEVARAENLIHQQPQRRHFVVVDGDENRPVLAQKLPQQHQPRIHHAQPAVVAVQRLALAADHLAQPLANLRAVDVVVVDPALVAGVVRRVDIDALHLPRIARQQGLQRVQVVALHDEVAGRIGAAVGIAARQRRHRLQQAERHLLVVFDDGFLADPVQRGHAGFRRWQDRGAWPWAAGTAMGKRPAPQCPEPDRAALWAQGGPGRAAIMEHSPRADPIRREAVAAPAASSEPVLGLLPAKPMK